MMSRAIQQRATQRRALMSTSLSALHWLCGDWIAIFLPQPKVGGSYVTADEVLTIQYLWLGCAEEMMS
jgi:hypothetical protein